MKKEVFIMDNPFLKLTVTDRQILNSYALMLNGLGAYLGDGYELVLHSLESLHKNHQRTFYWKERRLSHYRSRFKNVRGA